MTEYQCENEMFRPKCVVVKEVIYVVTFKGKKYALSSQCYEADTHETSIDNVFLIFDAFTLDIYQQQCFSFTTLPHPKSNLAIP